MIVKLKPLSFFKGSYLPGSDTLFGGICWAIAILYGTDVLEKALENFVKNDPPFLISSAFPWKEDKYYLPKPVTRTVKLGESGDDVSKAKKIKKIEYLSSESFNRLIKGISLDKFYKELDEKDYFKKIPVADIPHNSINRLSGASENIFYSAESFIEKGGMYFFLNIIDGFYENKLAGAINWLCERGVGGDGSIGKGHFEASFIDKEIIEEPQNPSTAINLSLLYLNGEDKELMKNNKDKCTYEIVKRKGKVEAAYSKSKDVWKKTVLMLKEGSCLPLKEGYYGENVVVKELSHKVWQYGYGYMVKGVIS